MTVSRSADQVTAPANRVLVIKRLFDVPRALVFDAFVDPRQALLWMGPRDYPITRFDADVRPGGKWRACLRAVNGGKELWQGGVYRDIVPPKRLVFTFAWDQESGELGPETVVTITFDDQGGKTLMTFQQGVFNTPENCEGHRGGWNSAFDRFGEHLATL